MPFAAVLARAGRCLYLRLSRFSARKGISGSGLCPLTMLRHLANLQAPNTLRQGFPLLLRERSAASASLRYTCRSRCDSTTRPGQRLRLPQASANSGDASEPCTGWPAPMIRPLMRKLPLILGCSFVAAGFPHALRAQLVRESAAPPHQQVSAKQDSQNPASAQTPQGKKRISQELQLTGENSWIDTTIDIQPGEHVLITATGKLRYAEAKDDNGPDGLPRGFKDLLPVLPFNEAGRGALLGRIGDKDAAQPFLVGARRDVLAPVSGRLSIGINQATEDTGDGTYAVRIEVYSPVGGTARVAARQVSSLPGIDNHLFAKIPRRVGDKDGNPGDMVNFLILGSEAAMQHVFTGAGWVKVDADVKDTILHGVIGGLSKEPSFTMPISPPHLFARPHHYRCAH